MNPVEEYLQIKEAGKADLLKEYAGKAGILTGTMAGATAGIYGIVEGIRAAHRAITKKRDFKAMLESNPDLIEARRENPRRFDRQWSSLRSLNPEFSSDPVVAGTYMRKMHMSPMTAGDVIVESLRGRQAMPKSPFDATPTPMMKAPGIGMQDVPNVVGE